MSKQLIWSQSSLSANKTMDDSLDLLFSHNFRKEYMHKKIILKEKSLRGLIEFIREIF